MKKREDFSAPITIESPDWDLLARQKGAVTRVTDPHCTHDEEDVDLLQGLYNFVTHVQDSAANQLGEEVVYPRYHRVTSPNRSK